MAAKKSVGYSQTPLVKKLGVKEGCRLFVIGPPKDYRVLLAPLPASIQFTHAANASTTIVHWFGTRRVDLAASLVKLRKSLGPGASIWVSWPKQASKVATDITEGVIREVALPLGFVDIKVCAVTEVWSGLKLVLRKELRGT